MQPEPAAATSDYCHRIRYYIASHDARFCDSADLLFGVLLKGILLRVLYRSTENAATESEPAAVIPLPLHIKQATDVCHLVMIQYMIRDDA